MQYPPAPYMPPFQQQFAPPPYMQPYMPPQQQQRPPRPPQQPPQQQRPPRQDRRPKGGRKDRRATPWQDGVFCQICKKEGHPADECWWRYGDDDDEDKPPKETKGAYGVDTNWYIDTGATNHVTGQLNKLNVHEPYQGRDQVHNASGQGMDIAHIGHSVLHTPDSSIQLRDILHVPDASMSLLSAHKLGLDNNYFMEIHPFFFLIKDQATRRIVFRGPCHGGLYPLVPVSSESSKHALVTIKPSSSTWHRRLGHPSSFIVQQILRKHKLLYSPEINPYICDPCQQAKSHQLPYPISTSVSTVPLEQIFSDVWGPAPLSVGKHSYYVSFIDDFSKFTWIYLLKKRSEVYQVFLDFQQYVERQFGRKILTMQTDWGGEYEKLNSFFQRVGIVHHVSCPHAHQQNGSAERKHRHIVEVGLALLANASMPLKYWDDAFITATFLINMLPTKVLNFETPTEKLLQVTPNYEPFRVFGCACWPNLRPYNKHKLSFRSKRCVFLGYSPRHKGVKCLDVTIGRVYISRDVVFDENIFPFASLNPNAGRRLREEILLLPQDNSPSASTDRGVHTNDHYLQTVPVTNPPQAPVGDSSENSAQEFEEAASNGTSNHAPSSAEKTTEDSMFSCADSPAESASSGSQVALDGEPGSVPTARARASDRAI
jgi:histone deacetylase 1/2